MPGFTSTLSLRSDSNGNYHMKSVSLLPPSINVTFSGYSATTTSNGYSIFVYKATAANAITYSGNVVFNVLLVAGGGSGGCDQAGGGGAGGFLQNTINANATDTISIAVGAGGVAVVGKGLPGGNSTFIFTSNVINNNMTAIGGGQGASYAWNFAGSGGSGGGGCSSRDTGGGGSGVLGQGNNGGSSIGTWTNGGGGGASFPGGNGDANGKSGDGGNGSLCTLPGIASSIYGTYYWSGGGGAGDTGFSLIKYAGYGGYGGGGGGSGATTTGTGDIHCINSGGNGQVGNNKPGGNGGVNTGGGGGGSSQGGGGIGGNGGSGIAIISVLSSYNIIS